MSYNLRFGPDLRLRNLRLVKSREWTVVQKHQNKFYETGYTSIVVYVYRELLYKHSPTTVTTTTTKLISYGTPFFEMSKDLPSLFQLICSLNFVTRSRSNLQGIYEKLNFISLHSSDTLKQPIS